MRRLLLAAAVVCGLAVTWAGPAAAVIQGPTPDGAGNWAICNWGVAYSTTQSGNELVRFRCTYGIGPDLAPLSSLTMTHQTVTKTCTGTAGGGVFFCEMVHGEGFAPSGGFIFGSVTGSWGGAVRQVLTRAVAFNNLQTPSAYFTSGVTGVAGPVHVRPDPTVMPVAFGTASAKISAWLDSWGPLVLALAVTAAGCSLVVVWLLRARDAAAGAEDTFERGYLGGDGTGGTVEVWESDEESDDEGDDDGADDDGDDGTSAGISDDAECLECGSELAYGWDYNYCEECCAMA